MTTVLVSVAVSAAVSLLIVLMVVFVRRDRRRPANDAAMSRVVEELTGRMDAMGRELNEALERTREESRRNRILGELASTIDLDEVLTRTLDAAGAFPGVDAAMISVVGSEEEPVTSAIGITPDEAQDFALAQVPGGRRIRSLTLGYGDLIENPSGEAPIVSGLAVPIQGELEPLGLLSVFSRASRDAFGEEVLAEIEALAMRAGPAIENARRFREARHQADLDALTGLHNRRYFHEMLAREAARAQRYNRRLALIVFDLDDFKAINDRIGHLAGDTVLTEVAERVRDAVRHSDVACRVGGDEFAVILPESTLEDAEQLYGRIQSAVSSRVISHAGRLLLSAGIAELRPQDDPFAFFQRADDALYRAKQAGKGRLASDEADTALGAPSVSREEPPLLETNGLEF